MKHLFISAILVVSSMATMADAQTPSPARGWTDAKSGKTIQGAIIDKKADASSVLLKLDNGKEVWIEAARLVADDREFIADWSKPFQFLTITKATDASGKVTSVNIKVVAKDAPISVVARPLVPDPNNLSFIFHPLKPGETKEFELPAEEGHEIKVSDASGGVLARETYKP